MLPWYESITDELRIFDAGAICFPGHLHDALEASYVLEGRFAVGIDGKTEQLEAGDMALLFPQVIHSYAPLTDDSRMALVIAHPRDTGDYARMLRRNRPRRPVIRTAEQPEEIPGLISQLLRYGEQADGEAVCRGYIQVLLALLWECLDTAPCAPAAPWDEVRRALDYVQQGCTQPMTLEQAAQALGMGRCRLSRLFTERLGIRFTAYVSALRVIEAKRLLDHTDLPVTEIAYACGFETPRTFHRVFLRECGITPRQYRGRSGS